MKIINHPLSVDTKVKVNVPICPCKGGGMTQSEGTVSKVIHNQSGYWYYLSIGITVKADRIIEILG